MVPSVCGMSALFCLLAIFLVVPTVRCQGMVEVNFTSYVKASNTQADDTFGSTVAVSGDTLVVGAPQEDSQATGVNGDGTNDGAINSGAAYVFLRDSEGWTQQAYLKASNTGAADLFGSSVAISGDTIVVGAPLEDSSATGVNGDQSSDSFGQSGAVYVFTRNGTWSQQAYLKANNTGGDDRFGWSVAIHGDTLVVGASTEASAATGVNGNEGSNEASGSGAAYVFIRSGATWSQQAYLKASNTDVGDHFGHSVAIYGDTIVVGAPFEDASATGVNGNEAVEGSSNAGAAYVFIRDSASWSQQAYLKASNTDADDIFGSSVAIAQDVIAVSAPWEDSSSTGVNGDDQNNSATKAGAVYMYFRSGTAWSQQAYLKASNARSADEFGHSVAMFGCSLLVGAHLQASAATGVAIPDANTGASESGAAYIFIINGASIHQVAFLKASNTEQLDHFGWSVAISDQYSAMGAPQEQSGEPDNQGSNSAAKAGAAYVFEVMVPCDNSSAEESTSFTSAYTIDTTTEETSTMETSWLDITTTDSSSNVLPSGVDSEPSVIVYIVIALIVLVVIGIASAVVIVWRMKSRGDDTDKVTDVRLKSLHHNIDILPNVALKEVIGKGAFGEVYLGVCDGTPCACKKLSSSDTDEAIKEAGTIFKLSHPNVVRLIGLHFSASGDAYLVLEYIKGGSLTDFLPNNKDMPADQLVDISIGVAQGMAYLERKGICHRDLAARNILIGEGNQPMISDFGMSRDNLYTKSSTSKIPVKWSAPEVLQQGTSTSKSDVFSFGIVLWEIFSFAMMPFSDLSNSDAGKVICDQTISEKLEQPEKCPDTVYQLMIRCWSYSPSNRPSFQEVLTQLQSITPRQEKQSELGKREEEDNYN